MRDRANAPATASNPTDPARADGTSQPKAPVDRYVQTDSRTGCVTGTACGARTGWRQMRGSTGAMVRRISVCGTGTGTGRSVTGSGGAISGTGSAIGIATAAGGAAGEAAGSEGSATSGGAGSAIGASTGAATIGTSPAAVVPAPSESGAAGAADGGFA